MKLRLYDDAKDENLFITELKVVDKPFTTPDAAKTKTYSIKVCDYKDKSAKFDEILSAVGDYFDLFRQNTLRLEDLWLQILEYLQLKPPLQTIFSQIHYISYTKLVIRNPHIYELIKEASKYRELD